jgi:hypothetical protein
VIGARAPATLRSRPDDPGGLYGGRLAGLGAGAPPRSVAEARAQAAAQPGKAVPRQGYGEPGPVADDTPASPPEPRRRQPRGAVP